MRHPMSLALLLSIVALSGCSPTFNWRELNLAPGSLAALFPCKPEPMVRQVNLDGHSLSMTMLGCQAGGASFALAYADLQERAPAAEVLARWRALTLGNMAAAPEQESSFLLAGVGPGVRVSARGKRPDGSAVAAQALWFAAGTWVFQASVLADKADTALADTFFAGLKPP